MTKRPANATDPIVEGTRRIEAGAPPPHVDAAVRAAARTAARRRRASAWTLPAALAATVLVAFSLVVQVQRDGTAPAEDAPPPADEPAAAAVLQEVAPTAGSLPMADGSAEKSAIHPNATAATARASRSAAPVPETPQDWLARIEGLEAAGRHEEAEAERRRLEEAYPGWLEEHAGQRD
jgi:hypothetical protein